MFGLIRFVISLVMLLAFVWFAVTVPLGKRTLWGHMRAIFGTQEAKDLVDGTEEEAKKVSQRMRNASHTPPPPDMAPPVLPSTHRVVEPLDPVDAKERRRMDHLVKQKTH